MRRLGEGRRAHLPARAGGVAALLVAVVATGCTFGHGVPIVLDVEESLAVTVRGYGVAVYEMDECPPLDGFTLDSYAPRHVADQFFRSRVGEPLGAVEPGRYAVVGLGLLAGCQPMLWGCEEVHLQETTFGSYDERPVVVTLEMGSPLRSVCGSERVCNDASCDEEGL